MGARRVGLPACGALYLSAKAITPSVLWPNPQPIAHFISQLPLFLTIFARQLNHIIKMKELALKYGCNPNQKPSRIYVTEGELPIKVLSGRPGYINFLDALNSWQLVKELKAAIGLPAAASFKHVSPAGAAVGLPLSDTLKHIYFVDEAKTPLSPIACAYARARGADRMSSYGDFIALSDTCDEATALLIKPEVSDGVIAPSYTPEALAILKEKRKGTYNVLQINPAYTPEPLEHKQVFGITFEQGRNEIKLDDPKLFENIPKQTFHTRSATRPYHRPHHP